MTSMNSTKWPFSRGKRPLIAATWDIYPVSGEERPVNAIRLGPVNRPLLQFLQERPGLKARFCLAQLLTRVRCGEPAFPAKAGNYTGGSPGAS